VGERDERGKAKRMVFWIAFCFYFCCGCWVEVVRLEVGIKGVIVAYITTLFDCLPTTL